MSADWQTRIMSERMEVDEEFQDELASSEFSRQQWGLIMTAVEFDVDNPTDPDRASLVAVTDSLPSVMAELDSVDQMGGMPSPDESDGDDSGGSGGLFDSLMGSLGLGGGGGGGGGADNEQLAAAETLAQDYANKLQRKLEQRGKWDSIRQAASDS